MPPTTTPYKLLLIRNCRKFKGHGFIYIYGTHLCPVVYLVSPAQTADLPFRAVVPLQQSKLGSYVCNPGLQKHLEIKWSTNEHEDPLLFYRALFCQNVHCQSYRIGECFHIKDLYINYKPCFKLFCEIYINVSFNRNLF